jgi:predicted transcriptional regulator
MTAALTNSELLTFAAQIVSAHVSHNAVSSAALPAVIQSVYAALSGLGGEKGAPSEGERPAPAVATNGRVLPTKVQTAAIYKEL